MKYLSILLVAGLGVIGSARFAQSQDDCAADGGISYICGAWNVEDLIHIRDTDWVLAGRLPQRGSEKGGFYLIDIRDRSYADLAPDFSGPADEIYAACPGAPNPEIFMAHGINIRYREGPRHQLYVVYHGERESVELFDLDVSGDRPTLTWTGCVIAPESASLNSVAHLPGDGFAVTSILLRTDPQSFERLLAGEPSGYVAEWSPGGGWARLPGTEFSGGNGIVASADGATLYVAGWGDNSLKIVRRGAGVETIKSIGLGGLHPDNIRYGPDGSLLIAGQVATSKAIFDCVGSPATFCTMAYRVVKVNPETLDVETLVDAPGSDKFGGATTAILVGDEVWIGTFRGNRIARFKVKD